MDIETTKKIEEMEKKIDAIYRSVEKTRKYFLWTMVATLFLFVVPLIGLVFALPLFIDSYVGGFAGLM